MDTKELDMQMDRCGSLAKALRDTMREWVTTTMDNGASDTDALTAMLTVLTSLLAESSVAGSVPPDSVSEALVTSMALHAAAMEAEEEEARVREFDYVDEEQQTIH